jgi:enterochelin esterase-like enzyme
VREDIPFLIYLPPCYEDGEAAYAALYLLHGYPMDETHWNGLGIVEVMEAGWRDGSWEPFLLVMPRIPDPLNTRSDGGPGSYEQEMLEGLVPYIENTYRVNGEEGNRALAGVSRGGVWALEIGFRNPNVFCTVAALSPALHVNNPRPAYDPFHLVKSVENLPTNIFISAAQDEGGFRTKTEELVSLLQTLEVPHTYLLTTGVHEDATWMAIMGDLVEFITRSWDDS